MGKVYLKARDGWSYSITDTDLLWMGRAAEGESTREAPHVIWTWLQRYAGGQQTGLGSFRHYASLTELVRAHSQPVNPLWARGGAKCSPGGSGYGKPNCAETLLQRRERISSLSFEQLSSSVRSAISALKTGALDNPVPGAIDFADKPVAEGFVSRHQSEGAQISYTPHGADGNHFITTARTRAWNDFVYLEYHSDCAWILIGDSQGVGMKPFLQEQLGAPAAAFVNVGYSTRRTLDELGGQIRSALAAHRPRFVLVVLGGNDAPQSRDMITRSTIEMLDLVRSTGAQVCWAGPAHAVDAELQRKKTIVSDIQAALCAQKGAFWMSGYEMTRDLQHAPDGVHFVRAGSERWARRIVAAIAPILPSSTGNLNPLWALTPFGSILALKFGRDC